MNGTRRTLDRNQRGLRDSVLQPTVAAFHVGPIPHGIMRRYFTNDEGMIDGNVNYFPVTGGMEYMPHRMTIRRPASRAQRYGVPTIDETMSIAPFGAGDAV